MQSTRVQNIRGTLERVYQTNSSFFPQALENPNDQIPSVNKFAPFHHFPGEEIEPAPVNHRKELYKLVMDMNNEFQRWGQVLRPG
jgi:hypothetical protein